MSSKIRGQAQPMMKHNFITKLNQERIWEFQSRKKKKLWNSVSSSGQVQTRKLTTIFAFFNHEYCNKVEEDFLIDRLILYIERKIVVVFRKKIIIDDFIDSKEYQDMFDNCFFPLFFVFKNNFLFLKLKNLFGNPKWTENKNCSQNLVCEEN